MSQWVINEQAFEMDLTDADFAEKYQSAFETLATEEEKLPKDGRLSEILKANCGIYYNLFDNIFGEGSGQKIFAGKMSISLCEVVFDDFFSFCQKEVGRMTQLRTKRFEKYAPKKR